MKKQILIVEDNEWNQLRFDRLTGLYSKEFFFRKVRERLREDPEGDYCIVCSNIENFKLVNDTFGAKAGDKLLRDGDTAIKKGEDICRDFQNAYGGRTFTPPARQALPCAPRRMCPPWSGPSG